MSMMKFLRRSEFSILRIKQMTPICKSMPPHLNVSTRTANGSSVSAFRSRIKHRNSICKSQTKHKKECSASEANPDYFDWIFDNQYECFCLSSESLSDLRVLSPRDYEVDDECLLVSLHSSLIDCRSNLFDGAKSNLIREASLTLEEEVGQKWRLPPIDSSSGEDLELDFPSPTFKMNSVLDVDVASMSDSLDKPSETVLKRRIVFSLQYKPAY